MKLVQEILFLIMSRNPLFIREGLSTCDNDLQYITFERFVAIPYLSGKVFQLLSYLNLLKKLLKVAIPYLSGKVFQQNKPARLNTLRVRRNPLFIREGLSTGYDWAYIWIKKITVAIPYLSGKVFQLDMLSNRRFPSPLTCRNPLFIREGLSTLDLLKNNGYTSISCRNPLFIREGLSTKIL